MAVSGNSSLTRSMLDSLNTLPGDGPVGDIATAEYALPADGVDAAVGLLGGRRDPLAQGGDAEHPPAGGDQPAILLRRAGMEDLAAGGLGGLRSEEHTSELQS